MELHDFRFYLEELHGQPISAKVLLKSSGKLKLGFFLRHLSYYIILNCHVEDITQPDVITGEGRTWLEIVRKPSTFSARNSRINLPLFRLEQSNKKLYTSTDQEGKKLNILAAKKVLYVSNKCCPCRNEKKEILETKSTLSSNGYKLDPQITRNHFVARQESEVGPGKNYVDFYPKVRQEPRTYLHLCIKHFLIRLAFESINLSLRKKSPKSSVFLV